MNIKLLVTQGRPEGKSLTFGPGEYYFGRGEECHVRFNSDWVSRQHCLLIVKPEGVVLSDLGSRNGTLVNGQLVQQERALAEGDLIQIGPVAFEVRLDSPTPIPSEVPPSVIQAEEDSRSRPVTLDSTELQPGVPPKKATPD